MTTHPEQQPDRDDIIASIGAQLTTVARRGTARVRRENEALSFVDQSLLNYIGANPGCRAVDIAAHFQLNRSTVSRQLAALAEFGLVVSAEPDASRGLALRLTDAGTAALRDAASTVQAALTTRLSGWTADELRAFAGMLSRYNDDQEA
ncbi:MarR family winged helix-turn-helix transcriptional regulator [Leifsonia sp. NPDC102414]|uniref:MarR family winged helix-turn-helix transcriptional regulator n=1 Tax=Leifsonia sp. NPDC102414 TaxID=3364124 RepID=UPI003811698E